MAIRPLEKFKSYRRVSQELKLSKVAKKISLGFLIFTFFILFMPWQQTSTGYGHVIAFSPNERPQVISAPVDGLILRWDVHEGSYIQADDPIVELRDNDPNYLERLKSQAQTIDSQIVSLSTAVQKSRRNLNRQRELEAQGISSSRELELAQIELSKLEKDLSDVEFKKNDIAVKLSQQTMQYVKAPFQGTIARILAVQGAQFVKKGDPLAILVPDSNNRAVEIWVDGNDLPLVRKGQKVRLEFEGWPAIQLASGFPNFSTGTFKAEVAVIEALGAVDGRFRVIVIPEKNEVWPTPQELLQGVRVRAWVILNQVTLGYEIWRRFNGFPNLREGSELEIRQRNFAPNESYNLLTDPNNSSAGKKSSDSKDSGK